jgi:RNA polymerase sigma factor (sigma-70 family)
MGSRRSGELFAQLETLFRDGAIGGLSDSQLLEQFVASRHARSDAAFRTLMQRHGPMVLRVCRSVLADPHEAEDAFQATFVALAQQARSIRNRGSVASWLHGTARNVALKAQTTARRRQQRERRVAEAAVVYDSQQTAFDDFPFAPIVHEEIERLPAKYRAPIVLCYLEGKTQEQAASELGWPCGTVRGRLARARDCLRERLTRRGVTVPAGLLVAGTAGVARAATHVSRIHSTISVARAALDNTTTACRARAVLNSIVADRLRVAALLICLAGSGGGFWAWHALGSTVEGNSSGNPGLAAGNMAQMEMTPSARGPQPAPQPSDRAGDSRQAIEGRLRVLLQELNKRIGRDKQIAIDTRKPIPIYFVYHDVVELRPRAGPVRQQIRRTRSPLRELQIAAVPLRDHHNGAILVAVPTKDGQEMPARTVFHDVEFTVVLPDSVRVLQLTPGQATFLNEVTRVPGGTRIRIPELDATTTILCTTDPELCEQIRSSSDAMTPAKAAP